MFWNTGVLGTPVVCTYDTENYVCLVQASEEQFYRFYEVRGVIKGQMPRV